MAVSPGGDLGPVEVYLKQLSGKLQFYVQIKLIPVVHFLFFFLFCTFDLNVKQEA